MANEKSIEFYQKEYDKLKGEGHPAAKHLKKILSNPNNKTNVLRNAIHSHCFQCSHDPSDPSGSHPKKCTKKDCPLYGERPTSAREKAANKPEIDDATKEKRAENAKKARDGKKLSVKEAMELIA